MFDESWSLTTERLNLRLASPADIPFVTEVWTDGGVRRFLGGSISDEEAAGRIWPRIDARELLVISIHLSAKPVGILCVSDCEQQQIELSYLLLPEHWNQGYATEAITALLGKLKSSFATYSLVAITQAVNAPSRTLLLRLGFHEERRHIEFAAVQITYGMKL